MFFIRPFTDPVIVLSTCLCCYCFFVVFLSGSKSVCFLYNHSLTLLLYCLHVYAVVVFLSGFGLVLWCLMPLSTIFQLYRRSVLLVEETGGPGENHTPAASHWQTWSHNVVHLALSGRQTHNISGDRHWLHW